MNVAIFVDKYGSAIDRLAKAVMEHNPHLNIKVFPVHPKRNDIETIHTAQQIMNWADLIDVHYWKSGEVIRQSFPAEFSGKARIVCHFNPYDFDKMKWLDFYDAVTVGNQAIQNLMPFAHLIPYCVDLNFWKFQDKYPEEKIVNMVVARIEGKKGVREVAQACKELGYKLIIAGRVSDSDYMNSVMEAGDGQVEFWENITDEKLKELYYMSAIHVCNSVDNYESGTLPIIESMACGVPVLTRNIGHVSDMADGKNMVVREGLDDDVEDLKARLKEMMENREWRIKLRNSAWETIKNRQIEKMARMYSTIYYKVMGKGQPLVSVIVPTFDRPDVLIKNLAHLINQTYTHMEIVVSDSGNTSAEPIVKKFREQTKIPIKYIRFENHGEYTLPKARNLGVMEAEGEIIMLCDERLAAERDAVEVFATNMQPRTWLWGNKDGIQKSFVENFSAVRRDDLIAGGMFNERIDAYGGGTQDIRERFEMKLGFEFTNVPARANAITKSGARFSKKDQIAQTKLKLWKLYGGPI